MKIDDVAERGDHFQQAKGESNIDNGFADLFSGAVKESNGKPAGC